MSRTRFRTRRGRPRSPVQGPDHGTPELQHKRQAQLTSEVIDLCHQRQWITSGQYWCALHFRWLYTLRFGCPGVTALDLQRAPSKPGAAGEETAWHHARQEEYRHAAALLASGGTLAAVLRIAVFDDPGILSAPRSLAAGETLCRLQGGLAQLEMLWRPRIPQAYPEERPVQFLLNPAATSAKNAET